MAPLGGTFDGVNRRVAYFHLVGLNVFYAKTRGRSLGKSGPRSDRGSR